MFSGPRIRSRGGRRLAMLGVWDSGLITRLSDNAATSHVIYIALSGGATTDT